MTSWAENLASSSRQWCLIARIEGVGRFLTIAEQDTDNVPDARYRFCSALPSYAGSTTEPADLWRPILGVLEGEAAADLPDILAEELQPEGGIADRSASLRLVLNDAGDFLTSLLQVDTAPITSITVNTAAATILPMADADAAGRLNAGDLLFVDGECMRVVARPGSSGAASINVRRAALDTDARPHVEGSQAYLASPFLKGRRVDLHVAPLDGGSVADERLAGRFVVDDLSYSDDLNAWIIDARAEVQAFASSLPETPSTRDAGWYPSQSVVSLPEAYTRSDWSAVHFYGKREIVRGTLGSGGHILTVTARGVAGTDQSKDGNGEELITARRVMVASRESSDFRYSPGASPSTDRSSGTWEQVADPVSILLCILTSSQDPADGLELTNYTGARGNYSSLPSGYGLGIRAADIDWDSFEAVRDRLPDVRLYNFALGKDTAQASKFIDDQILRPLQLHLIVNNGTLRLVKIRAPLAGQSLPAVNADAILLHEDGRLPDASIRRDFTQQAKRVEYEIGPNKVPAVAQVANPSRTRRVARIRVDGGTVNAGQLQVWQSFATSLARQAYRPRAVADVAIDASLWDVLVGDLVEITLPEAPDLQAGARGWTAHVAQCIYREIRADTSRGVYIQARFRVYNDGQLARRIAPAAWTTSIAGTDATVRANRFTDSDSSSGLPTSDVSAFTIGDVVKLANPDGSAAGGGTETVDAITPATHTLSLSGDFGGTLAADLLIIYADADDATLTQFARVAWLADNDYRVGTGNLAATYYEES